jgi:hypothetical protein
LPLLLTLPMPMEVFYWMTNIGPAFYNDFFSPNWVGLTLEGVPTLVGEIQA